MCELKISIALLFLVFLSELFTTVHMQGLVRNPKILNNGKGGGEWEYLSGKKDQEFPIAVVIELNESFLDRIKMFWGNQNTTDLLIKKTSLATFDALGLQENFEYGNANEFLKAVENLRVLNIKMPYQCPTMHALNELVQDDLSDGSILLMTGSKPLDEDFGEILAETLKNKKCRLSVLWFDEKNEDKYGKLKELALLSGGKFGFSTHELDVDDSMEHGIAEEANFQRKLVSSQVLENIKFPESNDSAGKVSAAMTSNQRAAGNTFVPIIVDVGSGASLENRQGNQIPFTVKNTLNIQLPVTFGAKLNDIPQIIQPQRLVLEPSQTQTIKVRLEPNPNTQPSASSTLTFTVFAPTRTYSRSAIISPLPLANNDRREPYIKHRYDGDCSEYNEPQTCEKNQWSLEITVHDEDSGLLKVVSEPPGLLFQTEFLAGIKQQITAYYTASCCQPKVDIWVEDLKGNSIKKSYDVLNQTLLAGEIAAIVVGVILLVVLIMAIIVGVIFYKRRNRRNLVIPRTTGSR